MKIQQMARSGVFGAVAMVMLLLVAGCSQMSGLRLKLQTDPVCLPTTPVSTPVSPAKEVELPTEDNATSDVP